MPICCIKTVGPNTQKHARYSSQDGEAEVAFIISEIVMQHLIDHSNQAYGKISLKHYKQVFTAHWL